MNLQKTITIPELIHLCETYGYSETLTALNIVSMLVVAYNFIIEFKKGI